MTEKLRVLLLDNSISVTGAFHSALAMAQILNMNVIWRFVLPPAPSLHRELAELSIASNELSMVELGRSPIRLIFYGPMLIVNAIRLIKLLRRENIQILVANDYYNLLPTAIRLMGWRGRIVTIVRLLPHNQQPLLNRAWIIAMRFTSNVIIAVSVAVQNQLPNACNAKLIYFPVGRGLESAPYTDPPKVGHVHFLYLANYIRGKGQNYALQAFAEIAAVNPDLRLTFVGGDMGLAKNAEFRKELITQADALGVIHMIEFKGSTDHVVAEIQAANVVLNFSDAESYSQTCVEAGLLGRPVIATRCGGPEEIIEDGKTGILVGLSNVTEMAFSMQLLANDSDMRQRMGMLAFERTRLRFGSDEFVSKLLPLLSP